MASDIGAKVWFSEDGESAVAKEPDGLRLLRPDLTDPLLLPAQGEIQSLDVSSNGRWIVYTQFVRASRNSTYVVLDTTGERSPVTREFHVAETGEAAIAVIAPGGRYARFAYVEYVNPKQTLVNLGTGEMTELPTELSGGTYFDPTGRYLAYYPSRIFQMSIPALADVREPTKSVPAAPGESTWVLDTEVVWVR